MFFRRSERKRCHPCITLALCALTAVGVVGVMNKGKCFIKKKMKSIANFIKGGCECSSDCD